MTGGHFTLTVSSWDVNATTLPIPFDASGNVMDARGSREQRVSMQEQLEQLSNVKRVNVSRTSLGDGQYTWRITILDVDFDGAISVGKASLECSTGTSRVTVTSFGSVSRQGSEKTCTGSRVVSGLTSGASYYFRVFATNDVGDGPSVVTSKPYRTFVVRCDDGR